MSADWNLWPWIVAEGAGEVALATRCSQEVLGLAV